ncbi:MAG: hypothetical protein Q4G64_07645, partial [bacterium]|nr:hypothetical protein [bacterium]
GADATVAASSDIPAHTAGEAAGAAVVPPSSGLHNFGQRMAERIDSFAQEHNLRVPGEIRDPENQAAPLTRRRLDPGPFVLLFIAALVVVSMVFAFQTLADVQMPVTRAAGGPIITGVEKPPPPPPLSEVDTDPGTEGEVAPEPEPVEPPVIANIGVLDPPPDGDGQENPELTYRAWDGDPSTWWRSRSYVDPQYGMKSGIGLDIQLAQPAMVREVVLNLNGEGGHVQVLGDPGVVLDPNRLVLAEADMGRETVITLPQPVEMSNVVLWFTSLPVADSDGRNRVEMTEVRVLGVEPGGAGGGAGGAGAGEAPADAGEAPEE